MAVLQDGTFKKRHMPLIIVLLAGCFMLTGLQVAHAAEGYVGLGIGLADGKFDKASFSFGTEDLSRNETMWRAFAGFQFIDFLGVEGGYINFGKARVTESVYYDYFETDMSGFEVGPVGFLPLSKVFTVFARVGFIFWSSDKTTRSTISGISTGDESGNNLALSLGARYNLIDQVGVRAEYTRYAVDKAKAGAGDFNAISASLVFAFYR